MVEPEITGIEKKRKRLFAYFCIAVCIPIVFIFTIVDIIEHQLQEILSNVCMFIVLIAGLIGIKKFNADHAIYRLIIVLLSLIFLYNIVIGSGEGTAVFWIFPFPLVFMYQLGKKEGSVYSIIFFCILLVLLLNPFSLNIYKYELGISLRFLLSLILVTLMAFGLEASRQKYGYLLTNKNIILEKEKQNLEKALREIKTLSGLIPICCSCKNVRNDYGYWEQVETYVKERSAAEFTHGICPECVKKMYPDLKNPGDEQTGPQKSSE